MKWIKNIFKKRTKLPKCKRAYARTIDRELVSIRPMDPPPPDWYERYVTHMATKGTNFRPNK